MTNPNNNSPQQDTTGSHVSPIDYLNDIMALPDFIRFKETYESIFSQVALREQFLHGFVTYEFSLGAAGKVVLRTLTKAEKDLIAQEASITSATPLSSLPNLTATRTELTLLFAIEAIADSDWHVSYDKTKSLAEYKALSNVALKLKMISNLPEYMEDMLYAVTEDMKLAAKLAVTETIKNQKSPAKPKQS